MLSEPLASYTTALTELGGQRVWSLLVSVFGDLAQDEGAGIDGPLLSQIMAAMDVRPEATRVALHRLRNDGWITSQKSGRTSRHCLTGRGRAETITASARIYATPQDIPSHWQLLITDGKDTDQKDALAAAGFTALLPRVYIGSITAKAPPQSIVLSGDSVPAWVRTQITPLDLMEDYAALFAILTQLAHDLPERVTMRPMDQAILRCLIVHNWRRLVLKHPDLPQALYMPGWREHDCRALVTELLARFPRPALCDLMP